MRCTYHCNSKRFEDYYSTQVGKGLSVFAGAPYQRGYGIGNILSGLTRSLVPLLQAGGKSLLKEGAKAGVNVARDLLAGQKLSSSLKRHGKRAGGQLLNQAFHLMSSPPPSPPGRRPAVKRRKTQLPQQTKKKTDRKKAQRSRHQSQQVRDIFS